MSKQRTARHGDRALLLGLIALLGVGACATAGAPAKDVPAPARAAYEFSDVSTYLDAGYRSLGLPGAGLMIWQDGQVVYEQTFGAYTKDTQVPIASASKWLSAAVIMTLVDEGKLSLEDTPGKYLPGFSGDIGNMTLRQMFSHSSGLVDFPGAWDYSITIQDYAARVAREGIMRAKPGTEVRYASASMQVAGAMAERVAGKLWNDLFLERIATPCGMTNTTFARQPTNRNPMLAGGAQSTLADYARFMEMIARGGVCEGRRVLSEQAIREMRTDQTKDMPLVAASNDRMGRASHYGLGQWLDVQAPDGRAIQVSSPGAFGFRPWLNLDRNLYGVFLMRREANGPGANDTFGPWVLIDRVHAVADRVRAPSPAIPK